MKAPKNNYITTNTLKCADGCTQEALTQALLKILPNLISADTGNTLVVGTDGKLKS